MLTQCGGRHSNEVRTFDSVLVQLGQEGNSLNSFTQTLRGEDVQRRREGGQISAMVTERFSNILLDQILAVLTPELLELKEECSTSTSDQRFNDWRLIGLKRCCWPY